MYTAVYIYTVRKDRTYSVCEYFWKVNDFRYDILEMYILKRYRKRITLEQQRKKKQLLNIEKI